MVTLDQLDRLRGCQEFRVAPQLFELFMQVLSSPALTSTDDSDRHIYYLDAMGSEIQPLENIMAPICDH